MTRFEDIDFILRQWEFQPGELSARMVAAADGRDVLQMRIDMGLLQFEVAGRPDGQRPEGAETYFDFLLGLAVHRGDDFLLTEEQCAEVDREFVQFYQRRLCWLALREFDRAVHDADHSLALMDFVRDHSPSDQWTVSHEQYRPFILFQRAQAAALAQLEQSHPVSAIEKIDDGIERIRAFFAKHAAENIVEEDELVGQLAEMKASLHEQFPHSRSLADQLAAAVAAEEFELAARLRDEISRRPPRR